MSPLPEHTSGSVEGIPLQIGIEQSLPSQPASQSQVSKAMQVPLTQPNKEQSATLALADCVPPRQQAQKIRIFNILLKSVMFASLENYPISGTKASFSLDRWGIVETRSG